MNKDVPELMDMTKKAVFCVWNDEELHVFDENNTLVNVYYRHDLEDMAIEHHNTWYSMTD